MVEDAIAPLPSPTSEAACQCRYNQAVKTPVMDNALVMEKSKGFGKTQSPKEKSSFTHFWVVEGEVWAFNNPTGGTIKPCKETSQYKSGNTESIDAAIQDLSGKEDGFYKFGIHEPGSKASWKSEPLSTATKRAINATKNLIASKKLEKAAMPKTAFK
jgi:hypothetical protein